MKKIDEELIRAITPTAVMVIDLGERRFYASLEKNETGKALTENLSPCDITLNLSEDGGTASGFLPRTLPEGDKRPTAAPGDIILADGDKIVFYFKKAEGGFTRIGRAEKITKADIFGAGGKTASVRLYLEWGE